MRRPNRDHVLHERQLLALRAFQAGALTPRSLRQALPQLGSEHAARAIIRRLEWRGFLRPAVDEGQRDYHAMRAYILTERGEKAVA
jgi:hypothetical protein